MKHFSLFQKLGTSFLIVLAGFILIALGAVPFYIARATAPASIIISEIGIKETADYEWIEIVNPTNAPIDIAGWKFYEDGTNHGLTVFRGQSIIAANEYAVIANKADLVAQKYPQFTGTILDSSWGSLKEDGEEIGLKDSTGTVIEVFTYPSISGLGISLERIDVNTAASEPTNWAPHPDSLSIGEQNENSLQETVTNIQDSQTDGSTTTETDSSTTDSTDTTGGTSDTSSDTDSGTITETGATTDTNADSATNDTGETNSSTTTTTITPPPPPPPVPSPAPAPTGGGYYLAPSANVAPKAIIQIQSGLLTAQNYTTINFDGRSSFDPNGDALTFSWDMGDGTHSTSSNPSPHKFSKPGIYIVALTVKDPQGESGTAQEQVNVLNAPAPVKDSASPTSSAAPSQSKVPVQNVSSTPTPTEIPTSVEIPGLGTVAGFITMAPDATGTMQMKFSTQTQMGIKAASRKKSRIVADDSPEQETLTETEPKVSEGELSDQIRITEIFPKPEKKSESEEWIELYNDGDALSLEGWTLQDSSKKKPYVFPKALGIAGGGYLLLPKSETKISLNDDKESLFLKDYRGTVIDSVTYEGAAEAKSYALLGIKSNDEVTQESWQWTSNITPGKINPSLSLIEGIVEKGDGKHITVRSSDKSAKEIELNSDALDPAFASLIMTEGSAVKLLASENEPGAYQLSSVGEIHPAEPKPTSSTADTWLLVTGISGMGLLNAPRAWEFLKPLLDRLKT